MIETALSGLNFNILLAIFQLCILATYKIYQAVRSNNIKFKELNKRVTDLEEQNSKSKQPQQCRKGYGRVQRQSQNSRVHFTRNSMPATLPEPHPEI